MAIRREVRAMEMARTWATLPEWAVVMQRCHT